MPYEYRKLSPKEREEIVNYRRAHGYPLHAPPHPFREAGAYLITAANFEHKAAMSSPERRTEFETRLLNSIKEIAEDLIAWVILANHYHVLLAIQSLNDVSAALKQLHGKTFRDWNIEDNLTGKRRVWYKFVDTYVRNDTHLRLAFNYIHFNPVKHGYVNDPLDWPWSSLRIYYEDKGSTWLQEQWNAYEPPADFGKGWDDEIKNDRSRYYGLIMFDWLYPYADKLRFPDEVIEAQFRKEYHVNTIFTTRLALVLGLILYSLFGILDVYAVPVSKDMVWVIRYVIVAPVMIAALVASYVTLLKKYIQVILCITAAVSGLGIVAMISITTEAEFGNRFYFTGLILVSMWAYSLTRLRFGYAVLANLLIMTGYEFASIEVKQLLESETGIVIFTMHNFFFLGANVIGMFGSYFLERYTRRDFLQKYTIQAQRDRADKLLYNVLPEQIAERLKESDKTIAEEFSAATVLFADIVNFTPISARFGPLEVVDMLNELFSQFDELVDKYNVEKIQVAGDGYMVAAGVPTPRPDHATVLAQLALDMQDYVRKQEFLGGRHPIEIRIGLNSGPLIAGVIGRKKYFYALWGDMVNTASRMESHGESGKIQITRETYELVKDEFECEYIGEIPVKGKGKMEAWRLLAKREERNLSHA